MSLLFHRNVVCIDNVACVNMNVSNNDMYDFFRNEFSTHLCLYNNRDNKIVTTG